MLAIEQIRKRLKVYRHTLIARKLGISRQTLHNSMKGNCKNSHPVIIIKLSDYFERLEKDVKL